MKFEWASVMVFNNRLLKELTPEFVGNSINKMYDWKWVTTMGSLPKEWNHLVGYDEYNPGAKLIHYTKGLPIWDETKKCEFARDWHDALTDSLKTCSYEELMGKSVHVAR